MVEKILSERVRYVCADNVDYMEGIDDGFFDLVIADPPYFKGPEKGGCYFRNGKKSSNGILKTEYDSLEHWDLPKDVFWEHLSRVGKESLVWGINYFDVDLGGGRLVWDKCNGSSTFSDCEIAYTSYHDSVRMFRYMWNGMMQGKSIEKGHVMQGRKELNERRIHQNQKPVLLWLWFYRKHIKKLPGIPFRILDLNMGSGTSGIAASYFGDVEYVGVDKDKRMFGKACDYYEEYHAKFPQLS